MSSENNFEDVKQVMMNDPWLKQGFENYERYLRNLEKSRSQEEFFSTLDALEGIIKNAVENLGKQMKLYKKGIGVPANVNTANKLNLILEHFRNNLDLIKDVRKKKNRVGFEELVTYTSSYLVRGEKKFKKTPPANFFKKKALPVALTILMSVNMVSCSLPSQIGKFNISQNQKPAQQQVVKNASEKPDVVKKAQADNNDDSTAEATRHTGNGYKTPDELFNKNGTLKFEKEEKGIFSRVFTWGNDNPIPKKLSQEFEKSKIENINVNGVKLNNVLMVELSKTGKKKLDSNYEGYIKGLFDSLKESGTDADFILFMEDALRGQKAVYLWTLMDNGGTIMGMGYYGDSSGQDINTAMKKAVDGVSWTLNK